MVSYGSDLPAVFPDWSPYPDLGSAARAYLRDPDIALDALATMLGSAEVLGFTLERFVNEVNGVWQEVVVCDGRRLILRRQPTSVTADSGTTRSDDVIEPTGPSPGGTSSPCHRMSRRPSQTMTSSHTPLTSLTNRTRVKPSTSAEPSMVARASSAMSGSRRYARAAEPRSG